MKPFVQIYNPREDSPEVLRRLFIGRTVVLEEIMHDLERQIGSPSRQHWLIRAPRGYGKTHLAAMIYHSIIEDPRLAAAYHPIWLSESAAYEVYSAGSFLERIATELIHHPVSAAVSSSLRQELDGLPAEGDDPHLFDAVLESLKGASSSLGKLLVVIVENFDSLLNSFSPRMRQGEAQRVRSMMQHDHEIMFIGTTPTHYLPGLTDPKAPLYGQFRERRLEALTEEETIELFDQLAEIHGEPAKKGYLRETTGTIDRERVFHRLTGGIPRSIVMLFHVVAGVPGIKGLVNDVRSLLDVHTAYFEARLAKLAPRERVILSALAAADENLTAQEIARLTRLPQRSISTQIRRLTEEGHIAEAAGSGGKGTLYEVSDGMLRLWYQFREGRRLLEPIVRFLSYWHSPEELARTISQLHQESVARNTYEKQQVKIALEHVEEAYRFRTSSEGQAQIERFLSECVSMGPAIEGNAGAIPPKEEPYGTSIESLERFLARIDPVPSDDQSATAMIRLGIALTRAERFPEAIETYHSVIDRFAEREESMLLGPVAMAHFNLGITLGQLGRTDEAMEIYRAFIERFGEREEPPLLEPAARAQLNLGITLGQLGRTDEAMATFRDLIERFSAREEPTLLKPVARAQAFLGFTLGQLGRTDEEIEVYRDLIERFSKREESILLEQVAGAQVNLGVRLGQLGRTDEEIEVYRALIKRFSDREEPILLEQVAMAQVNLGRTLGGLGRTDEAMATFRDLIERFSAREEPILLKQVAKAQVNLGRTLGSLGRTDEEMETFRDLIERFIEREEPILLEQVASIQLFLGFRLGQLGRTDEEIEVYRDLIERFSEREEPILLKQVARAQAILGFTLGQLGRTDEEIEVYRDLIERFSKREESIFLEQVAMAQVNLGRTLGGLGRTEEAMATFRDLIERFSDREEPILLKQVAKAQANLGLTLGRLGRTDEAMATFRDLIERFSDREEPILLEQVASIQLFLGFRLGQLGRTDEEMEVYRALIGRFSERDEATLLEQVARAQVLLGITLGHLGRTEEEVEVYRALIGRFSERDEATLLEQVARAQVLLGITLGHLGRTEEEVETYLSVIEHFSKREEPTLLEAVAEAQLHLGMTLRRLGRPQEAIETFQSAIESPALSGDNATLGSQIVCYTNMIELLRQTDISRAHSIAENAISSIIRHRAHISPEVLPQLLRSLFLSFDDVDLRRWIHELESLEDAEQIAETAQLYGFVVDVLEAPGVMSRAPGLASPKKRRERVLGRVPVEYRKTVTEMVDEVLQARRERTEQSKK
jgi:tetratricopeptide (TPR) repeat protein